jgi:hypothetical protein
MEALSAQVPITQLATLLCRHLPHPTWVEAHSTHWGTLCFIWLTLQLTLAQTPHTEFLALPAPYLLLLMGYVPHLVPNHGFLTALAKKEGVEDEKVEVELKPCNEQLGVVASTYSPSSLGGRSRRMTWAQEFQASLENIAKPSQKVMQCSKFS